MPLELKMETEPGVTGESRQWAEVFVERGESVITQLSESLKPGSGDGIHGLRVAIRRLLTAMSDLRIRVGKRRSRKLDRELRSIAHLAGKVRDHDVAIEILFKVAAEPSDPSVVEGLIAMIERRREQRARDLDLFRDTLTIEKIAQLTESIRSLTGKPIAGPDGAGEKAAAVIGERRKKFMKRLPVLYDPTDRRGHHRLRIAAKHLRYSVELFERSHSRNQTCAADRIAAMQDHLGNMHDCDVWIGKLRKTLKRSIASEAETTSDFLGAEWLLGRFVRRRANNYRSALQLWAEWRNTHFLESLVN